MGGRQAVAALGMLLFGGVAATWTLGRMVMDRTWHLPGEAPRVTGEPERGRHLVEHVLACGACHGDDLGGARIDGGIVAGRLVAPNLTAGVGGVGGVYGEADWVRALRHGVGRDGGALLLMRARRWSRMTEQDVADVVAWLVRLPPVDRTLETPRAPVSLPLWVAGHGVDAALVEHAPAREPEARVAPDAAYGRYLADLAGCHDCHGADLRGARVAWTDVAAPDISPGSAAERTGAAFADAVVRGIGRGGRPLDPVMPWRAYAGLDDTELDALWQYVRQGSDGVVGSPEAP